MYDEKIIKNKDLYILIIKDDLDIVIYACDENGKIVREKELIIKQHFDENECNNDYIHLIEKMKKKNYESKYFLNRRVEDNFMLELPKGREVYNEIHKTYHKYILDESYPDDLRDIKEKFRIRREQFFLKIKETKLLK